MSLPPCFFLQADVFPAVRVEATRILRKKGWRQQQVADALSISQAMVSRYSRAPPSTDILVARLAQDVVDGLHGEGGEGGSWCTSLAQSHNQDTDRRILSNLLLAEYLLRERPLRECMPQVGMNLAMATPGAKGTEHVMAFPNRFHGEGNEITGGGPPTLGASNHLAQVVLAVRSAYQDIHAAANIRGTPAALSAARRAGQVWELEGGHEDRISQILRKARNSRKEPQWIHDPGAFGVEPCLYVLGPDAVACIDRLRDAGLMHAE